MFNHGIQVMDFPAYSPDLNPIENVWSDLKRRVQSRNPKNIGQLEELVREEWELTDPALLRNLVVSMRDRCEEIVVSESYKIHY